MHTGKNRMSNSGYHRSGKPNWWADGMRAAKAQGWRYDRAGRWRCPDCVGAGREIPVPDLFKDWP